MSPFANCTQLQHKAEVYIPSTVDVDHNVNNGDMVKSVARDMAQLFGGSTSQSVTGYWVAGDGTLVIESPTIVYSFISSLSEEAMVALYHIASEIKSSMKQEAVLVSIDGSGYLV